MKLNTRHIWRDSAVPVVVDASALDWLAIAPLPKHVIRIITPHPGRARLLRTSTQQVQTDRPAAAQIAAASAPITGVVLKGHQTRSAAANIHVNSSGNPHLAQGGSGDLLAGYLTGLLATFALQADPEKRSVTESGGAKPA